MAPEVDGTEAVPVPEAAMADGAVMVALGVLQDDTVTVVESLAVQPKASLTVAV